MSDPESMMFACRPQKWQKQNRGKRKMVTRGHTNIHSRCFL